MEQNRPGMERIVEHLEQKCRLLERKAGLLERTWNRFLPWSDRWFSGRHLRLHPA
jgi:hypothetical protein